MNNFYVYAWVREDYDTYFYIGKGYKNRCYKTKCRSKHFQNILKHTNCHVKLIKENLTESEALEFEIKTLKDLVENQGYSIEVTDFPFKNPTKHLVNKTWGGEGTSGFSFKQSEETIRKRVAKNTGQRRTNEQLKRMKDAANKRMENPNEKERLYRLGKDSAGRIVSDETKEKISASNKGRKLSEAHKQKLREHYANLDESVKAELNKKRRQKTGTKVLCIEINRQFDSFREVEEVMKKEYGIYIDRKVVSKRCRENHNQPYGVLNIDGEDVPLHWQTFTLND